VALIPSTVRHSFNAKLPTCNGTSYLRIWFVGAMSGERVVQGLYDYAAADTGAAAVQDLNFKKGDYMVVISE